MSSVPSAPEVAKSFRRQGEHCAAYELPLSAALLASAADDIDAGGPVRSVLPPEPGDPGASALGLRFLAALHRQVLSGRAPSLAAHFPSVGGTAGPAGAWPLVLDILESRPEQVAADVRRPCQTNEPGRCVALLVGLLDAARQFPGLPIRLLEFGASAGLNLYVDRYRIGRFGPAAGPVLVAEPWSGAGPEAVPFMLAERSGCDRAPVDARSPQGRLSLRASV